VARALEAHFGIGAQRIVVHPPGFDAERFAASSTASLRSAARRALGLDDTTPLIGLVTSGDFEKRGLSQFMAAAERIAAQRRDARFLVVGSKRLPDRAADHPLTRSGRVLYRPKGARPELWMGALDVFLYPALFEEFGLVVMEALALAVPVITTRRVGAVECLPDDYAAWVLDAPEPAPLAERALALLESEVVRRALGTAGAAHAAQFTRQAYVEATIATLLAQKR
jgi:glycosyltransferase involved in cell wall biosynthesis